MYPNQTEKTYLFGLLYYTNIFIKVQPNKRESDIFS